MPRQPKPRWHAGNQQWVSDVGEPYVDGKGRKRRRTVPFPGIGRKEERKARAALQAYLDAEAERERVAADPTVQTVCELYLEWVEANRQPSTYDSAASRLSKFTAYVLPGSKAPYGRRRVSEARDTDLRIMLDEMGKKYKPSYCVIFHATVQAAFNWAARRDPGQTPERIIPENPFKGVETPTRDRSPERYAERKEMAAFLRWAWRQAKLTDSRGRPALIGRFDRLLCLMLRVLIHTGARPGELCIPGRRYSGRGLTWQFWDPDAKVNALGQRVGMITLPPTHHKTGGKTKRPREIVVPPVLTRAIERHRAREWSHPEWVFTHRRSKGSATRGADTAAVGEPWRSCALFVKIRNWRRRAVADAKRLREEGEPTRGLELIRDEGDNRFVLYRLRHTRITDLIGADIGLGFDQAGALTGTSGKMVQQVYGHLTGSRLIDLDQATRRKPPDRA